jgi:hypothetical protein
MSVPHSLPLVKFEWTYWYIIIHYIFYDTGKGNRSFSDQFQLEIVCTVLLKGYPKEGKVKLSWASADWVSCDGCIIVIHLLHLYFYILFDPYMVVTTSGYRSSHEKYNKQHLKLSQLTTTHKTAKHSTPGNTAM